MANAGGGNNNNAGAGAAMPANIAAAFETVAGRLATAEAENAQLRTDLTAAQQAVLLLQQAPRRTGTHRIRTFGFTEGESWLVWKSHFRHVSRLNGFNDLEMRLALAAAMVDKAAATVNDINVEQPVVAGGAAPTVDDIMDRYQQRFIPAAASQLMKMKFDSARQGASESLLGFHGRLRALYNEAYPNLQDQTQLVRRFIGGIRKPHVRLQLNRQNPPTYTDALEIAQNEDSAIQLNKVQEVGAGVIIDEPMEIGAVMPGKTTSRPIIKKAAGDWREPEGTCHFCNKKGHWKKDCIQWKRSRQNAKRGSPARRGGYTRSVNTKAIVAMEEEEQGQAMEEGEEYYENLSQEEEQDF